MLVNFSKKFIFLRPCFCGSTSFEFALSKFCQSKNDIVTPISFPEEISRRKIKIFPQNYASSKIYEKIYNLSIYLKRRGISDFFFKKGVTLKLKNHDNLETLLNFKEIDFSNFKIISIRRHPYEKALSCAKWKLVKHRYLKDGFKITVNKRQILDSLDRICFNQKIEQINNWPIYSHKSKFIVDIMIDYNKLMFADKSLQKHFNLGDFKLPNAKKFNISDNISISDIPKYIKKIVIKTCAIEFEKFSYKT